MNAQQDSAGNTPILIVEDSLIQAELLRRMLAHEGYRVTVAGKTALKNPDEGRVLGVFTLWPFLPRMCMLDVGIFVFGGHANLI